MSRAVCAVERCDKFSDAKGFCNLHYQRWYRHGDPLATIAPYRIACEVDGCETLARYSRMCVKHFRRFQAHGDTQTVKPGGRPPKRQFPSWSAAHKRVQRDRGKASAYCCIDCGKPADEWSYNNLAPLEITDPEKRIRYALEPKLYEPRCVGCHRRFDADARRERSAADV